MNIYALYYPISAYFRRRRIAAEFRIPRDTRVLDVGGSLFN